jgi:hypothetical protein
MPKDTHHSGRLIRNAAILSLLQTADEDMLCESDNPVYLKLREEVDQLW